MNNSRIETGLEFDMEAVREDADKWFKYGEIDDAVHGLFVDLCDSIDALRREQVKLIVRALHAEKTLEQVGDMALLVAKIPEMWRHLVMDTPKDQKIHDDVVALSDRIVADVQAKLGHAS